MVVILDTKEGTAYNFKTRKDARRFIGVSAPTLRMWLKEPFFLYKSLIITDIGNGKIEKSKEALHEKIRAELYSVARLEAKEVIQGALYHDRDVRVDSP